MKQKDWIVTLEANNKQLSEDIIALREECFKLREHKKGKMETRKNRDRRWFFLGWCTGLLMALLMFSAAIFGDVL